MDHRGVGLGLRHGGLRAPEGGAGARAGRAAGRPGRRLHLQERLLHGQLHVALPFARPRQGRPHLRHRARPDAWPRRLRERLPARHGAGAAHARRGRARHVPHEAHGRARRRRVRAHHLGPGHRRDSRPHGGDEGEARRAGLRLLFVHRQPGQAVLGGAHALRRHLRRHHVRHRGHHGRPRRVHGHEAGVRPAARRARHARLPEFQDGGAVGPQRGRHAHLGIPLPREGARERREDRGRGPAPVLQLRHRRPVDPHQGADRPGAGPGHDERHHRARPAREGLAGQEQRRALPGEGVRRLVPHGRREMARLGRGGRRAGALRQGRRTGGALGHVRRERRGVPHGVRPPGRRGSEVHAGLHGRSHRPRPGRHRDVRPGIRPGAARRHPHGPGHAARVELPFALPHRGHAGRRGGLYRRRRRRRVACRRHGLHPLHPRRHHPRVQLRGLGEHGREQGEPGQASPSTSRSSPSSPTRWTSCGSRTRTS